MNSLWLARRAHAREGVRNPVTKISLSVNSGQSMTGMTSSELSAILIAGIVIHFQSMLKDFQDVFRRPADDCVLAAHHDRAFDQDRMIDHRLNQVIAA